MIEWIKMIDIYECWLITSNNSSNVFKRKIVVFFVDVAKRSSSWYAI